MMARAEEQNEGDENDEDVYTGGKERHYDETSQKPVAAGPSKARL